MKCKLCEKELQTTFLGKINGTYKRIDGKQETICNECQRITDTETKE